MFIDAAICRLVFILVRCCLLMFIDVYRCLLMLIFESSSTRQIGDHGWQKKKAWWQEFCSFGHRFRTRLANGEKPTSE